jgi:hypothetical protein
MFASSSCVFGRLCLALKPCNLFVPRTCRSITNGCTYPSPSANSQRGRVQEHPFQRVMRLAIRFILERALLNIIFSFAVLLFLHVGEASCTRRAAMRQTSSSQALPAVQEMSSRVTRICHCPALLCSPTTPCALSWRTAVSATPPVYKMFRVLRGVR